MNRLPRLSTLLLLCCASQFVRSQEQSLKAEVSLTDTSVRNSQPFSLTAVVRNTGSSERSTTIWLCSNREQWLPDNPIVHVVEINPCQQNAPTVIKLKPGERYKGTVTLHIDLPPDSDNSKGVTFRLRFAEPPHLGTLGVAPMKPLRWSNAVTVFVKK